MTKIRPYVPMTPAQITRGISMRHYAWGKRIKQIADEAGVGTSAIYDCIMAKPLSPAIAARLEGYLLTPAGPSALVQDNDRGRPSDSPRFALLRRVIRCRRLAQFYGLPICGRERLKKMTANELRIYCYNLGDRIKCHIMSLDQAISRHWKLADDMEAWEFIERIDLLRAIKSLRDAKRTQHSPVLAKAGRPAPRVLQLRC